MGEVSTEKKHGGQKGKPSGKKLSTRVDMTPVVDLAFLLLTFFMLATTFIKPQVMELILPEKNTEDQSQPKVNEKKVLSIVLGADNKIYWFVGMTAPQVNESDYSSTGIRKVLQEQNTLIEKMVILIKPDDASTYENLVDILDEIQITGMTRYALVEFTPEDKAIMARFLTPGAVQTTSGQS
jgi:biopolymer transport protein ExbD